MAQRPEAPCQLARTAHDQVSKGAVQLHTHTLYALNALHYLQAAQAWVMGCSIFLLMLPLPPRLLMLVLACSCLPEFAPVFMSCA